MTERLITISSYTHTHTHTQSHFTILTAPFAFNALMLLVGRQEGYLACKKTEWLGTGMVICLE